MKFSQHIGKGAWAFASRGLPLVYAVAWLFVARKLPVAEFGTLAVFQSLFAMLFTFSDGFALQAIVKFGVEPNVNLEELVTVTVSLFIAFISLALTILLIFRGTVGLVLNNAALPELLPWLAVFAILTMPRVVFSKVLQGNFRMKEIFFVDFGNFGVASVILGILLYLNRIHSALDVIQITVATGFLSSLVATVLVRKHLKFRVTFSRAMLSKISNFVRYQAAMGVVWTAQQNFDTLIVSAFTGAAGTAIYSSAKLVFRGFDVVRDTVGLFIFPATSKYHSRNDLPTLRTILEKSVSFLYLGLIPICILLAVGAPVLFHILYGAKYDASIPLFRLLLIAGLALPIQIVLAPTMSGMGKIKELFHIFIISFIISAAISAVLLATIGIAGAAIGFISGTVALAIQYFRYIHAEVGISTRGLFTRGLFDAARYARSKNYAKSSELGNSERVGHN